MPTRAKNMRSGPGAPVFRRPWQTTSDASAQRIRGRRGQAIRASFLARHPLCAACEKEGRVTPATIVDHVIPLAEGGADDDTNKQGLCDPHNKQKSAAEAVRGRARGRVKSSQASLGHR